MGWTISHKPIINHHYPNIISGKTALKQPFWHVSPGVGLGPSALAAGFSKPSRPRRSNWTPRQGRWKP